MSKLARLAPLALFRMQTLRHYRSRIPSRIPSPAPPQFTYNAFSKHPALELRSFIHAPYNIAHSTLETIRVQALDYLNSPEVKHLVLSAPHAGASNMLTGIVTSLANDLKAHVIVLDYARILNLMKNTREIEDAPKYLCTETNSGRFENAKLLPFTEAFSPGPLEIIEDEFDEAEDDDEEDEGVDMDAPKNRSKSLSATLEQLQSKLVFHVKMPKDSPGKDETRLSYYSDLSNQPSAGPISRPLPKKSFYTQTLLREYMIGFFDGLKNDILLQHKENPDGKIIVYLQDVVDLLRVPRNCGKRLVAGIMDVVTYLKSEHNVPVILIAGSSPALTVDDNISKGLMFYLHLFEGMKDVSLSDDRQIESYHLLTDGSIFKSNFDQLSDFEKIEVFPPSPLYSSLQRFPKRSHSHKTEFLEYLDQMEIDLKARIRQINWKNIVNSLNDRNVNADDIERFGDAEHQKEAAGLPEDYMELIHSLEQSIWNSSKIHRLILLTVANAQVDSKSKSRVIATRQHLFNALATIYESDISRLAEMEPSESCRVVPSDDGPGDGSALSVRGNEQEATESKTNNAEKLSGEETVGQQLKKNNAKLNQYEKRLLSTVVNPSIVFDTENIPISMNDLVLPSKTKLLLQTLVTLPMLQPQFFKTGILARSSINGVLLFGPPGTGKTMLAKALAKTSGAKFMAVSLSDIFDKYVGEGEKNVKAIFTLARKLSPCVIFLDEVDALFGARRQSESNASRREIMNEFMQEWDGPFDLDDAILRRMPRRVLVDLPTEEARKNILKVHLQGEILDESISIDELAKKTNFYSGSDLKNMCVAAALLRVKESLILSNLAAESDAPERDMSSLVQSRLEGLEDYSQFADNSLKCVQTHLKASHFEAAMKEVGASLADDASSVVELRKWDAIYGDNSKSKKKAISWGFGAAQT